MKKLFTFFQILLVLMAFGINVSLQAQTVIKVGASQGAKQTTIQMAYDSVVPSTVAQAYVLELQSDYEPTTEVYPIKLKAKAGASATNTITIKPAAGVKKVIGPDNKTVIATGVDLAPNPSAPTDLVLTGKITSGAIANLPDSTYIFGKGIYFGGWYKKVAAITGETLTVPAGAVVGTITTGVNKVFFGPAKTCALRLDSAKFVIVDGVSRTGETGLTIQNPNSIYAQTILFTGTAQNNTIKNCIIRGANVSGAWLNGYQGTIFFQALGTNICSNNVIDNNDICDMNDPNIPFPLAAFQMTAAGGSHKATTVSNNNIYNISDQYTEGSVNFTFMQFGSEGSSTDNQVLNNRFFWTAPVTFGRSFTPFNIGTLSTGNRFENNVIGYGAPDTTGVATIVSTSSWGTGNGFRFFTCKNNTIGGINFTGTGFRGLWVHTTSTSYPADDLCNGNTVADINFTPIGDNQNLDGIYINNIAADINVTNNTVKNIKTVSATPANKCNAYGIRSAASAGKVFNFSINKISGITAGDENSTAVNTVVGLDVPANTATVERNFIADLKAITAPTSTTGVVYGLRTTGSNTVVNGATTGIIIKNNIMRLGVGLTNDATVAAYYQGAATVATDLFHIYNNSIYIGGAAPASATKNTYGILHVGTAPKNHIKNNIIANNRTIGGTEAHYTMQFLNFADIASCDYNVYQFSKYFGNIEGLNVNDLAIWAASVSSDAHSVADNPKFVGADATVPDMRILGTSPAKGTGVDIPQVTNDFNGATRSTMDIGALIYVPISAVSTISENKLSVYASQNGIVVNNQAGMTATIYSVAGKMVKSVILKSDKENISLEKGLYFVRVNDLKNKVLVK